MKNIKNEVRDYLIANSNRSIIDVYNELKAKKRKSIAEKLIFIYLKANKKELGVK